MKSRFVCCAGLLWLAAALPSYASAGYLAGDTYVNSANAAGNFGTAAVLNIGNGSQTLLQFDLSRVFPATFSPLPTTSSTIGRATLRFYVNKVVTAGQISAAPLQSAWSEGTVTYGTLPLAGAGVTSGTISTANQMVAIDVTSIVQGWINDQTTNFGLLLSSAGGVFALDSKEAVTTSHPADLDIELDNGYRGVLKKTMTLNTPGIASLMSISLTGTQVAGGRIWYTIRATDGAGQLATEEGVIQFLATPNSITCNVNAADKLHLGTVNSGCTPGFFNPSSQPGVSIYDNVSFSSPAPIAVHEVFFRIENLSGASIRMEP